MLIRAIEAHLHDLIIVWGVAEVVIQYLGLTLFHLVKLTNSRSQLII